MVGKIQTFLLGDGDTIAVEVDAAPGEAGRFAELPGGVVEETHRAFGDTLKTVQKATSEVLDGFRDSLNPSELELSFGLKFSAKAGVVLASTDAQATLTLRAKWKRGAPSD